MGWQSWNHLHCWIRTPGWDIHPEKDGRKFSNGKILLTRSCNLCLPFSGIQPKGVILLWISEEAAQSSHLLSSRKCSWTLHHRSLILCIVCPLECYWLKFDCTRLRTWIWSLWVCKILCLFCSENGYTQNLHDISSCNLQPGQNIGQRRQQLVCHLLFSFHTFWRLLLSEKVQYDRHRRKTCI